MKKLILSIFLLFLIIPVLNADEPVYTVRTLYFQPTDAPDLPDTIAETMQRIHAFYATEMDRYDYGKKTFRMEADVHVIKGKHPAAHYADNDKTSLAIRPELPNKFLSLQNIHIIFVGGLERINRNILGIGVTYFGIGVNGGYAILPADNLIFRVVVHEVGHTFGLLHNEHDTPDFVMGVDSGHDGLDKHECRWLEKSYYFNENTPPVVSIPKVSVLHPIQRAHDDIQFQVDVQSDNGVYQAEIARTKDHAVIAVDYLVGKQKDTAIFDFNISELEGDRRVMLRTLDVTGIYNIQFRDITIPTRPRNKIPETIDKPIKEPETIPEQPQPRLVPTRLHLTTSWASMKARH